MMINAMKMAYERGAGYLVSVCKEGRCIEFDSLRFGPSGPWVTACVGSALLDLGIRVEGMLKYILASQRINGGWAYNAKVPADADSTLRALQYLALYGHYDDTVTERAERFVLSHQMTDGGISTFRAHLLLRLVGLVIGSWNIAGWTTSHGCVSALALNVLREPPQSLRAYIQRYLSKHGVQSYWWRTPLYISNELDRKKAGRNIIPVTTSSTIEMSLKLIMQARRDEKNESLVSELLKRQLPDGRFIKSDDFRIPRPHQSFNMVVPIERPGVRTAEEKRSLLSTAAAIVALHRQYEIA